ncbi:MAG: DMT family transporter [Anaerovoracaceae bacterium]|jgi:drug/metabolite transporter (DMT)-like permease
MSNPSKQSNAKYHVMLTLLVISWGLEYSVAKDALNVINSTTMITFKYAIGAGCMAVVLLCTSGFQKIRRQDLPMFILCAIFGQVMYFFCEYRAMATIPVAVITIVLGFVPILSIIVERILYRHRSSPFLVICMFICVAGIILTIGADFSLLTGGSGIGYLFTVGALVAWVIYNFLTGHVSGKYPPVLVAFYQMGIACLLTLPYSLFHLPAAAQIDTRVVLEILYLGAVSAGFGFLVEVIGIQKLGPTTASVYSNFLPVTTAFFGVILLGQELTVLQILGGVIVIVAGLFVIREKAHLDFLRDLGQKQQQDSGRNSAPPDDEAIGSAKAAAQPLTDTAAQEARREEAAAVRRPMESTGAADSNSEERTAPKD